MKAYMFAVVLSFVLSLPTQALTLDTKQAPAASTTQVGMKINLNKASAHELTGSFKGIGAKRAEAIVSYRDANGGFKAIADLAHVRGLGKTFVDSHLTELEKVFSIG